jgi:hypothetical protein
VSPSLSLSVCSNPKIAFVHPCPNMKIAFAATIAVGLLLGRPSGASSHAGAAGKNEVEGKEEHGLDGSVQTWAESSLAASASAVLDPEAADAGAARKVEAVGRVRGSSRSLECVPRFAAQPFLVGPGPLAPRKLAVGPIGPDQKLMVTTLSPLLPPAQRFYTYITQPFYVCNKQYQQLFPGMVGYTVRAYTNGPASGCNLDGDFNVVLKLYDVVNKKVVKRQREHNSPYVLYGNEYPFANFSEIKYGSILLPDGVYQASATMYLANGTQVDQADFGTNIVVVSC